MTKAEEKLLVAATLLEIAEALNEGAAGPVDYWFKRLGERLNERARKIMEEIRLKPS